MSAADIAGLVLDFCAGIDLALSARRRTDKARTDHGMRGNIRSGRALLRCLHFEGAVLFELLHRTWPRLDAALEEAGR
ncbi:hypothetical protein [Variovorax sp. Sphag1AA]|uniref:hypothetical protein n=1 Tax=Variovorax sp. Sphag1AA TaxID=2587027 RepID=UPI001612767B|nr:hypothetical protein [Variovorax sp. Sphag1AA]MBB3180095.1 hypothetical protein [Variovorax sp. Sphag1AA]